MSIFDRIRKFLNKLWYGTEVRPVKVHAKDIEENIARIQKRVVWVHKQIDEITTKMEGVNRDTEEGKEKYAELEKELKDQNELLGVLQKEEEQEYVTLKKFRESRHVIAPKDAIIIGGLVFLGTFAFALERENPKALKICSILLKIFPLHL